MNSRAYQENSIDQIREKFKQGYGKVLLWLATGGGKTFIFCKMVKEASLKGKKCIIVVRGRKLVDQASQRLFREGVTHGVLMANHWNYRPTESVQVCSIDTLISRKLRPVADLIIIDEAHLSSSNGYKEFLYDYPKSFIVSVTATPWVESGLRHVADQVVHPITMQGLIDLGFLVPFRYFAPSEPDLTNVEVSRSTKDYVTNQLEDAMVAGQLTGKIIHHWKKIVVDKPTICFAVNVNHSKILVDRFNQEGIRAEHCDADIQDSERNEIIKRLESGETKVVSNVGIFCTGVDIPSLGAIIMARPTKSLNLFIQQAGRGARIFEGKSDCILLDHAGNIGRHGFPTDEYDPDLDGEEPKERTQKEAKICKACFAAYKGVMCPECGTEPPAREINIKETDEELKEIKGHLDPVRKIFKELMKESKKTGKKTAWVYYKLVDKVGFDTARPYLPQWFIEKQTNSLFARSPYVPFKP